MADFGRPTEYKPEYVEQARKLCELGATDIEIADFFEVDVRTVYRWKHQHPDFCQAVSGGKEAADERVERSLYHRAVGYTFDAVKVFNNSGEPLVVPYREHVPPDVGAVKMWLVNRRGDRWRDKQEVEHGGQVQVSITGDDKALL